MLVQSSPIHDMALFKRTYLCLNRKGKPLNPSSRSTYHILEYLVLTANLASVEICDAQQNIELEFQYICSVTPNPDLLFGLFSVICYLRPNVANQLLYCCIYISNYPFHCHYCVSQHVLTTQSISHQSQMLLSFMSQFFKFLLLSELLFIKMPGVCPRCDKNVYFAEEVLLSF